MFAVPAELADKARIAAEKRQQRNARYRASHQDKRSNHHAPDELRYRDYPFIMWDGEAPTDAGYSLFGSSAGHIICKPHLATEDCFDLLLRAKLEHPKSIFFWFGGRYDWDEITRQSIPLHKLNRLKTAGTLWWHGYRLTEIEGKVYTIQKDGVSVRIYETTGWFHTTYIQALRNYGIGTNRCSHGNKRCDDDCRCDSPESPCQLCRIELGKSKRGGDEFLYRDIEEITRYMFDELSCGPALMDRIRDICHDAGFNPRAWYGPSALARELLTRNNIYAAMADCGPAVNRAAQFAFAGGRFENFRGGVITRPGWIYDENSAYMSAALDLPNLARGNWREGREFEPGKFAVYNISYHDKNYQVTKPQPLFRRLKNGTVCWPRSVTGWYWSPEAELVKDDPGAVFHKAYIFDEIDAHDRPFNFVKEIYRRRLILASLGNDNPTRQAEKALKWALAAIYGQLCRIVGWDRKNRKPAKTHQLEWAGYITSKCRADMYRVAMAAGDSLISIDTDSVTALCRLDVREGIELGEWKTETFDSGAFFQNGVYFTYKDGQWSKGKTRGMERRQNNTAAITPEILIEAIRTNRNVKLQPKKKYVTTRMAINGQMVHHGTWRSHPGNVLEFGGGGKRYHNRKFCGRYCNSDFHVFLPSFAPGGADDLFNRTSVPHFLPWKDMVPADRIDVKLLRDILWIDRDNVDSDDEEWVVELIGQTPETNSTHMVSAELQAYGEETRESAREYDRLLSMQPALVASRVHSGNAL